MTKKLSAFLVLLVLLVATACSEPVPIAGDAVASVEGEEISYAEFETYLRDNVGGDDLALEPSVASQLFDQFLDERLLVQLALDSGLTAEVEELGVSVDEVDQRTAARYLLAGIAADPADESTARAYYEAHREDFRRPESVDLRQILVPARETAEAARDALDAGEDFAQVAARFSQVPITGLGAEGGRLSREDLPPAFVEAIFALAPGETSPILAADYGFHIFQVVEYFPAADIPYEDVSGEITSRLEREHSDALMASFVAEARERYPVTIYRSNFPFDYRGDYTDE